MRIIIAGGTGFVGNALVHVLIDNGHQVLLLQRSQSRTKQTQLPDVEVVGVDLEKPIISDDIKGDAIINLVGIIREFPSRGITFHKAHFQVTKNLIDFAQNEGIRRFLQMSALGVKADATTGYEQTKYAAECYLRESGLDWTIFRPSIIIGPGGGLVQLLSGMIQRLPVVPIVGNGQYKVQPIYVGDVISGFVKALGNPSAFGRTFEIGGPEIMTFEQMIDIIGEAMGRSSVRKFHQPIWLLKPLAALFDRFPWFPLTREQLAMLIEENYSEDRSYYEFFGISPKRLKVSLKFI
jgi:uncharacterized protein YbjT (DUF2867 family)